MSISFEQYALALSVILNVWLILALHMLNQRNEQNYAKLMRYRAQPVGDVVVNKEVAYPRCPSCGSWECYPTDDHECSCPECHGVFSVDSETKMVTPIIGATWTPPNRRAEDNPPLGSVIELLRWLAVAAFVVFITNVLLAYYNA